MQPKLYKKIEKWLSTNTFHNEDFNEIKKLVKSKRGRKISVVIPTLNEEKTVGIIIKIIKKELMQKYHLVDEIVVIDSGSEDNTRKVAKSAGAKFFYCDSQADLPVSESPGKGTNLWTSLYLTEGDIICWVDADIKNFHPKFIYGLIGPILTNNKINYVKAFYKRPLILNSDRKKDFTKLGGGRTTELCFRPLVNIFFPELTGFIQPLSGEYAGKREILEKVPFYSGYSVETGLLIKILEMFGIESMAQVDLDIRIHRNQELRNLRKQAYVIANTILKEAITRKRHFKQNFKFHVPSYVLGESNFDEIVLKEKEWPPMILNNSYRKKRNIKK